MDVCVMSHVEISQGPSRAVTVAMARARLELGDVGEPRSTPLGESVPRLEMDLILDVALVSSWLRMILLSLPPLPLVRLPPMADGVEQLARSDG